MGLELDSLKENKEMVIYNNTTGEITSFYSKEDLKIKLAKMNMPTDYFEEEDIDNLMNWTDRVQK